MATSDPREKTVRELFARLSARDFDAMAALLAEDVVFILEGRVRFKGTLERLLEDTGRESLEEAIADLMLQRGALFDGTTESADESQPNLRLQIGAA